MVNLLSYLLSSDRYYTPGYDPSRATHPDPKWSRVTDPLVNSTVTSLLFPFVLCVVAASTLGVQLCPVFLAQALLASPGHIQLGKRPASQPPHVFHGSGFR